MDLQQVEPWIASWHGVPTVAEAAGVFVAVVQVYRGVGIGLGSSRLNALCDLYLDLCSNDRRDEVATRLEGWERKRRDERAKFKMQATTTA